MQGLSVRKPESRKTDLVYASFGTVRGQGVCEGGEVEVEVGDVDGLHPAHVLQVPPPEVLGPRHAEAAPPAQHRPQPPHTLAPDNAAVDCFVCTPLCFVNA